jgi:hypothetical protein
MLLSIPGDGWPLSLLELTENHRYSYCLWYIRDGYPKDRWEPSDCNISLHEYLKRYIVSGVTLVGEVTDIDYAGILKDLKCFCNKSPFPFGKIPLFILQFQGDHIYIAASRGGIINDYNL